MKRYNCTLLTAGAALLLLGAALPAVADTDPLFTFGFTDLDGDYSDNGDRTGTFTAVATSEAMGGPYNSAGDVTRVLDPGDTANYDAGFVNLGTMADFTMSMDISDVTGSFANATGEFRVTDADGDYITGNISGTWERLSGNFGSFDGTAGNVMLHTAGNGQFDGPSGGSWDMNLPFGPIYNGAIIVLETGSWFSDSFNDTNTQVEASIVPVPGAVVLGLIGFGALSRRRRSLL